MGKVRKGTSFEMREISDEELNEKLMLFLTKIDSLTYLEGVYFELLYMTGVRANEPLELERWEIIEPNWMKLTTLKTNEIRHIPKNEIPNLFWQAIEKKIDLFARFNYPHLRRMMIKYCEIQAAITGQKDLKMHLFRHNKAKQLFAAGAEPDEIINYFAWKQKSNFEKYVFSKIYI